MTIPEAGAEGILICVGGDNGGWSFHVQDGRLVYHDNWFDIDRTEIVSEATIIDHVTLRFAGRNNDISREEKLEQLLKLDERPLAPIATGLRRVNVERPPWRYRRAPGCDAAATWRPTRSS